jgi:uracil-DNA glycosylase
MQESWGTTRQAFIPRCRSGPTHKLAIRFQRATQTVFDEDGEDVVHVAILLVDEQPGDQEEIAGKPFVKLSGKLLDRCLRPYTHHPCYGKSPMKIANERHNDLSRTY